MFEVQQGPPWRIGHRYAGCRHCIIAPIPERGYEIIVASDEISSSLLQEIKAFVMPPGSGWEAHIGKHLQRFATSSCGGIISGSLFVLDESDEFGRRGVVYGHAIVTSRKEFEILHDQQPNFLEHYVRFLYWNADKRIEATMVDIILGLRGRDPHRLRQGLSIILHMMSVISPWSVVADLLAEDLFRPGLLDRLRSRRINDLGLKRALRSGYCVLFECPDPDGERDFEPLMHECLHALVTSRREFRFTSRALGEEENLDVACADHPLVEALMRQRLNRTLVVCRDRRAVVVRSAASLERQLPSAESEA